MSKRRYKKELDRIENNIDYYWMELQKFFKAFSEAEDSIKGINLEERNLYKIGLKIAELEKAPKDVITTIQNRKDSVLKKTKVIEDQFEELVKANQLTKKKYDESYKILKNLIISLKEIMD